MGWNFHHSDIITVAINIHSWTHLPSVGIKLELSGEFLIFLRNPAQTDLEEEEWMKISYATYMYLTAHYCTIIKLINGTKTTSQTISAFMGQQHTKVKHTFKYPTISSYPLFIEFILFPFYYILWTHNVFLSSQY